MGSSLPSIWKSAYGAEWWNDNATFNENAIFISMENISVLTGYLCKNGLRNPDGSVKHVILSEQGYTHILLIREM